MCKKSSFLLEKLDSDVSSDLTNSFTDKTAEFDKKRTFSVYHESRQNSHHQVEFAKAYKFDNLINKESQ